MEDAGYHRKFGQQYIGTSEQWQQWHNLTSINKQLAVLEDELNRFQYD